MPPVRIRTERSVLRKRSALIVRPVTRSGGGGEVDFLPHLPPEVQQIILRQLPVKDLAKCLLVSKSWYSMVNVDMLWKRHCILHGIDPTEAKKFVRDTRSSLCKWGQIWRSFRNSPAFGWRARCWRTLELDRGTIYMKNASDDSSLVFCTGSILTLRRVSQLGKTKYTMRLPLPSDSSSCLAVDNKYIAVAKCNIVLIYKLGKHLYKCIMALSMEGETIHHTRKYISRFVKKHLKENVTCVCIIALSKGCIWLREHGRYKTYVVNIITEKVSRVETHFYRFVTQTYIVSWSHRKLRVDNYSGRNILKLCRDINKARANNHILVTFGFTGHGADFQQVMETWELSSGKRLLCISRPKHAFFELHPSRDILYQIESASYNVTSLSPLTGEVFWSVRVPCMDDILNWSLRVVCGRYLVLYQLKSVSQVNPIMYVFDAIKGNYLYKTERPPGHLEHLSDSLMIAKTEQKIYVRTFSVNS